MVAACPPRKPLLEPLIAGTPGLQFNAHETGDGELVRQHACKLGFEGVVSKTVDANFGTLTLRLQPSKSIQIGFKVFHFCFLPPASSAEIGADRASVKGEAFTSL
jgi:hypothetical protein